MINSPGGWTPGSQRPSRRLDGALSNYPVCSRLITPPRDVILPVPPHWADAQTALARLVASSAASPAANGAPGAEGITRVGVAGGKLGLLRPGRGRR